ncbi:MAG: hypothetical protein HFE73_04425 [Firmicutes bacterium]|nr:hypothetical protein [Bacillota bacterium]
MRRFFSRHKVTRKHAVLRNIAIIAVLCGALYMLVNRYAAANTPEQAMKRWQEENFFGSAEMTASLTYEDGGKDCKTLYFGKDAAGESGLGSGRSRYEGALFLEKKNPFKWEVIGSQYGSQPAPYGIDLEEDQALEFTREGVETTFSLPLQNVFPELASSFITNVMITENTQGEHLVFMDVGYLMRAVDSMATTCIVFQVNLDQETCMMAEIFDSIPVSGIIDSVDRKDSKGQIWLSEERMIFMAQVLYDFYEQYG